MADFNELYDLIDTYKESYKYDYNDYYTESQYTPNDIKPLLIQIKQINSEYSNARKTKNKSLGNKCISLMSKTINKLDNVVNSMTADDFSGNGAALLTSITTVLGGIGGSIIGNIIGNKNANKEVKESTYDDYWYDYYMEASDSEDKKIKEAREQFPQLFDYYTNKIPRLAYNIGHINSNLDRIIASNGTDKNAVNSFMKNYSNQPGKSSVIADFFKIIKKNKPKLNDKKNKYTNIHNEIDMLSIKFNKALKIVEDMNKHQAKQEPIGNATNNKEQNIPSEPRRKYNLKRGSGSNKYTKVGNKVYRDVNKPSEQEPIGNATTNTTPKRKYSWLKVGSDGVYIDGFGKIDIDKENGNIHNKDEIKQFLDKEILQKSGLDKHDIEYYKAYNKAIDAIRVAATDFHMNNNGRRTRKFLYKFDKETIKNMSDEVNKKTQMPSSRNITKDQYKKEIQEANKDINYIMQKVYRNGKGSTNPFSSGIQTLSDNDLIRLKSYIDTINDKSYNTINQRRPLTNRSIFTDKYLTKKESKRYYHNISQWNSVNDEIRRRNIDIKKIQDKPKPPEHQGPISHVDIKQNMPKANSRNLTSNNMYYEPSGDNSLNTIRSQNKFLNVQRNRYGVPTSDLMLNTLNPKRGPKLAKQEPTNQEPIGNVTNSEEQEIPKMNKVNLTKDNIPERQRRQPNNGKGVGPVNINKQPNQEPIGNVTNNNEEQNIPSEPRRKYNLKRGSGSNKYTKVGNKVYRDANTQKPSEQEPIGNATNSEEQEIPKMNRVNLTKDNIPERQRRQPNNGKGVGPVNINKQPNQEPIGNATNNNEDNTTSTNTKKKFNLKGTAIGGTVGAGIGAGVGYGLSKANVNGKIAFARVKNAIKNAKKRLSIMQREVASW